MKSRLLGGPPACSHAGHGHSVLSKLHAGSSEWKQSSTVWFLEENHGWWQGICSWSGWNGWRSHNTILWNKLEENTFFKGIIAIRSAFRIVRHCKHMKSWMVWTVELVKSCLNFPKISSWQSFKKSFFFFSGGRSWHALHAWAHWGTWRGVIPSYHLWCSDPVVLRWSQSCAVERWMVAFTCCIAIQGPGTVARGVSPTVGFWYC